MLRRKRPRVVWLPADRSNRLGVGADATIGTQPSIFEFRLTVGNDGSPVVGAIPLVADNPTNIALAGGINTLADVESSAYRLRRIVGKIFVSARQASDPLLWSHAYITCGIIVLRVNDQGDPLQNLGFYDPAALDGVGDPWIWRRTYAIGNNAATLARGDIDAFWPETNITAGSAPDGPHVDQKTARVISSEERLFLVVGGIAEKPQGVQEALGSVVVITGELRVLASMRSSQGNRRNASR